MRGMIDAVERDMVDRTVPVAGRERHARVARIRRQRMADMDDGAVAQHHPAAAHRA